MPQLPPIRNVLTTHRETALSVCRNACLSICRNAYLSVGLTVGLIGCGSSGTDESNGTQPGEIATAASSVGTSESMGSDIPQLGAATIDLTIATTLFDDLDRRAVEGYTGLNTAATITAEIAGRSLSGLLAGPLTPTLANDGRDRFTSLIGLPYLERWLPFRGDSRRGTWPELAAMDDRIQPCAQGSMASNVEHPNNPLHRPYLRFTLADCHLDGIVWHGDILVEQPENALDRPSRVGYDELIITSAARTRSLNGTLTWTNEQDCRQGLKRTATLLTTHINDASMVLFDQLESYTSRAPVFADCTDVQSPNAWQGRIAFGDQGVVNIDSPEPLSHDWFSLPRGNEDEVIFGSNVEIKGLVRLRGELQDTTAAEARITLEDARDAFPQSAADEAIHVGILGGTTLSAAFTATLLDTWQGALSQLSDSDDDGMPDSWETLHGLNPADAADAHLNADGDDASNLEEYLALRNPVSDIDAVEVTD